MIESEAQAQEYVSGLADPAALSLLERYSQALRAENEHQNLVSKPSLDHVWQRHIADSAQLLELVPRETSPWLDLGTGPGLPGIVLAILRPQCRFVLVESRRRRVAFLESICAELDLSNVTIEGCRLEVVDSFRAGAITARAFAPLPRLLDLSERFSTGQTWWVLPKGRSAAQELQELPVKRAGMFHVERSRTDPQAGILVGKRGKTKGSTP